jgi:hypothetical protein
MFRYAAAAILLIFSRASLAHSTAPGPLFVEILRSIISAGAVLLLIALESSV